MAVCNLFNDLSNRSGNFLLFSQYVEDLTRNFSDSDNWKVVPSKFIALNIDYSSINSNRVYPNGENLNEAVPKYFQNCFENACAYGREKNWIADSTFMHTKWTPEISRNLFWNNMFDGEFLHATQYGNTKKVNEIVFFGDVSMQSYNEHQGIGYEEIYCYIPAAAQKMNCQVILTTDIDPTGRTYEIPPIKNTLEGHKNKYIDGYIQQYFYNKDFTMEFDDEELEKLSNSADSYYDINTIVVLYDIFKKFNDSWIPEYVSIPMGIYFTGYFEDNVLTNKSTKYTTTSYGSGTSYGLRICTRFSISPTNAVLNETEFIIDDTNYTNVCQLMTAMNENLSRMLDVVNSSNNVSNQYKELLSIFKNNKTNVPYVKDINGTDFWFVNGRAVSAVNYGLDCCNQLAPETVKKRLDNLMDNDTTNDFSYIEDPNGCDCLVLSNEELAEHLGIDFNETPDDTNPDSTITNNDILTKQDIASDADIADILNRTETPETQEPTE